MCIILYDERINRYRRMQDISVLLDSEPSPELCLEMVECDILQRKAHLELTSYNDHHTFINEHPLIQERNQILQLENSLKQLKKENPVAFLNEISNITQNIRRIESNIRTRKYKDDTTLESWKNNLNNARLKQTIISHIINL